MHGPPLLLTSNNTNGDGLMYGQSLLADSKVKFAAWPMCWRPTFSQVTQLNSGNNNNNNNNNNNMLAYKAPVYFYYYTCAI